MLYGIKELWLKRGGMTIPLNKGGVTANGAFRRAARMYIDIKVIPKTIKFNISIMGSHPSPNPHIRLSISTKYFVYKQGYGSYTVEVGGGTNATIIRSSSIGTHDVTIEVVNLPIPAVIGLVQNTVDLHSESNYLYTHVDGEIADTQFWDDDRLINIDMSESGYTPTDVLRLSQDGNGGIVFERLLP
jgi:hypothetical protein